MPQLSDASVEYSKSPSSGDAMRGLHRVLVVDDSAFMRQLIADEITSTGEFEVVGTAKNGVEALRLIALLNPDVVTLDVEMPGMDGLAVLNSVMKEKPRPIVMLSAGTSENGADATLSALECGAVDFVRKPSGSISLDLELVRDRLLEALRTAVHVTPAQLALLGEPRLDDESGNSTQSFDTFDTFDRRRLSHTPYNASSSPNVAQRRLSKAASTREIRCIVAIASSTGGPAALAQVIPWLPAWDDVAVIIVQHMPPGFTNSFARRLSKKSAMPVSEARSGFSVEPGNVYVAPGAQHLRIIGSRERPVFSLEDSPPLWGVRPAADLLFTSVAEVFGSAVVGVVMTGMGRDGADGLRSIRRAGGLGVVQESSSCVVAGMPEAAFRIAGADARGTLETLPQVIDSCVGALRC